MIAKEEIEKRIFRHKGELADLQTAHQKMVTDNAALNQVFQQAVVNNQNRFQQLSGMIAELTEILQGLNGAEKPETEESK